MSVETQKDRVRAICGKYSDRELRARRLYIEERAASMQSDREREFEIRKDIARHFRVPHTSVSFSGSAQLGFSVYRDREFVPAVSDLDAACISPDLYQRAWIDVASSTRGFSDLTVFGGRSKSEIELFQDQILKRGMIRIEMMPRSSLSGSWSRFLNTLSRNHFDLFSKISVAIYMNEYAFCWKQDSALTALVG